MRTWLNTTNKTPPPPHLNWFTGIHLIQKLGRCHNILQNASAFIMIEMARSSGYSLGGNIDRSLRELDVKMNSLLAMQPVWIMETRRMERGVSKHFGNTSGTLREQYGNTRQHWGHQIMPNDLLLHDVKIPTSSKNNLHSLSVQRWHRRRQLRWCCCIACIFIVDK